MDYGFWWEVAHYGNEAWRGKFSEKEVAENAYEYYCEWAASVLTHKVRANIKALLDLLREDGNTEFLEVIETEIKYRGLEE